MQALLFGEVLMIRRTIAAAACAFMVFAGDGVFAQTYPAKPVRIVTSDAGGGNDFAARIMAPVLAEGLGQQVIIDNRGAALTASVVAKSPPDGYTIAFAGTTLWLAPFLRESVSYDPVKDFAPITIGIQQPTVLVIHPSLPSKSVKELIALARARPGELNYASGPIAGPQHLTGELFKAMAGINIVVIPYRGAGPGINALVGGHVEMMFPSPGAVASHVKSGRLRALAVTSAQPSPLLPGLPPIAATVPGYESMSIVAYFAPAGTAQGIVSRLNQELVRTLNRPDVKDTLLKSGVEAVGGPPEQVVAMLKTEMAKWGRLIKDAGIRE
jgi:tripartite-type tricarboxylate transporter receptor subunit TctC